jgi:hypothetical protein
MYTQVSQHRETILPMRYMRKTLFVVIPLIVVTALVGWYFKPATQNMRKGCNLAAVNMAYFDCWSASDRMQQAKEKPSVGSDELHRLEQEYRYAKRRLEFLEEDVRKRGHRDSYPEFVDRGEPSPRSR